MITTPLPLAAPPTVSRLLERLDPEQRAAALLPDGPALIIAPAGSGKTTTLIARLGVLLARGVPAARIAIATFNRDAALELSARIEARLTPLIPEASQIEVRTLHALARQILLDAGEPVRLLSDRLPILRALLRRAQAEQDALFDADEQPAPLPDPAALDTVISAWKVEERAADATHRSLIESYQAMLAARGMVDFDDLVVGAAGGLESDPDLRRRWQARFTHLCVDEFQDVDAAQLRLVRLLAEPEQNLFVVGDDDQTIFETRTYRQPGSRRHSATAGPGPYRSRRRRPACGLA
jgi:DNA helicase-2/ATP-dependent DNA helicase PcrA